MSEQELEFCRECGMEFADEVEDPCPLCGNELGLEVDEDAEVFVVGQQLDDVEKCAECGKWYDDEDEWFWDYWHDFDGPEWLSIDYVWCFDCILKRFKKDNSDFEESGLEPDSYLIWKEALDVGIDLGPKLFDIEMSNVIRRLRFVDRDQMIRWLDSDCPIDEVDKWTNLFDEFDEAMAWRDAGFSPDLETVGNWLKWECSPEVAANYIHMGLEYVPGERYKELGVGLDDAVFFEMNGMSDHPDNSGQYNVAPWLSSGLNPAQIVALRDQIVDYEYEIEEVFRASEARLKYEDTSVNLWRALPNQFKELQAVGLSITVENLLTYWGLTSKEILKVIDSGGDAELGAQVLRQGGSLSKLGVVKRLIELGTSSATASLLSKRGFLVKHLKEIENGGYLVTPTRISMILESDADMKVDEALSWLKIDAKIEDVKRWRGKGFSAQEASKWIDEGFSAEMASRWRDSGVKSPSIAKRRQDAGLNP